MYEYFYTILFSGRVLIEFDSDPLTSKIIFDGVFRRAKLAVMLVDGNKHRQPGLVSLADYCIFVLNH